MEYHVVNVRKNPEYLERAVEYFSSKWGVERRIYQDCISNSLLTSSPLPRWYLMVDGNDEIIGSYGLITNDFISRQDLCPWMCALFVDEKQRGKGLGGRLLAHAVLEAKNLGFEKVYLATDHVGFYEKYGWSFIGIGYHPWGDESRIYEFS